MTVLETLLNRIRRTGALLIIGFILIIYIALGFLIIQQDPRQKSIEKQIAKVILIATRPLPGDAKLRQEYGEVNKSLAPIAPSAVIELIVSIAKESGIGITAESSNISIPQVSIGEAKIGKSSYQILSFTGISVQGDDESVMAFISDLDSGKTLENMVLQSVTITQGEVNSENVTVVTASINVDIYTKGGK